MKARDLTELQLDALCEIGGIGAGHAATALSQLVDRLIELDVPRVEIVDIARVPGIFGGPERLVLAVYARMLGDISGGVLFTADRKAALALVDMMHGRAGRKATSIGHEEEAWIRHVASIVISAYLGAVSRMTDLEIIPSSPVLAFDMAGALLEAAVAEVGMKAVDAVFVRTTFMDKGDAIESALFFVPDPDSLSVILGRLGLA